MRARVSLAVGGVDVRAALRQELEHRQLAVDGTAPRGPSVVRGVVERAPSRAVGGAARRAVRHQQARHVHVALLRRHVKRLHSERRALRNLGASLQQHASHIRAAPFR